MAAHLPDTFSMTSHEVTSNDGVTISIDSYHHAERQNAVIICPGFFQSKETATFQRMSRALAEAYDVLAMDFRGHGRSSGLYTFSAREGADLDAVLRWAAERYPCIGVIGFSLGGAIAMNTLARPGNHEGRAGARHPMAVRTLVAVSAPSSFEEIEFKFWTPEAMRTGLQGLEPGAGCRPGNPLLPKERPIDSIRLCQGIPTLFIHGTRDVIVGVQHSHRLYAAAAEPKRLEIVEGGSHAHALFRDDPQQFTKLVLSWLAQTLSPVR